MVSPEVIRFIRRNDKKGFRVAEKDRGRRQGGMMIKARENLPHS